MGKRPGENGVSIELSGGPGKRFSLARHVGFNPGVHERKMTQNGDCRLFPRQEPARPRRGKPRERAGEPVLAVGDSRNRVSALGGMPAAKVSVRT